MEDITQIYSKEILDEAELVSNLQDNLKDLDKDGIDDFLNYFLKSKFSSEDRFHQFFQNLHVCLRERPLSIFIYADTIYRIFCELKEPLNQKFKDEFTFAVHYRISEIDVAFDEPQLVFIINLLLERSFYTKEEIVEICKKLIKTKSLIVTQISVMFFFAPEMIELQQKLFDRFMKECNNLNLSSWFIFDRYSMAKKLYYDTNDWGKWREIRKTLHFGNPLFKSLIEDDVELLKLLSSHPNFSPNDTIKIPFMAPFDYLHQDPPILGVSAFFGSVKCFRHLSMLGADFEASDIIHHTPAQFATAGGNLEIIRFIEQHQCDFSGCLQVAAGFSRYDFFEYLHETKYPDISVLDEWRANVIGHATIENNPKILLRCIEEGVDVNIIDSSNKFPLFKAASYSSYDVLKILLATPNIDINQTVKEINTFIFAVELDDVKMVKLLITDERLIIDQEFLLKTIIENSPVKCMEFFNKHPKINFLPIIQQKFYNVDYYYSIINYTSLEVLNFLYDVDKQFIENSAKFFVILDTNYDSLSFLISKKLIDVNGNKDSPPYLIQALYKQNSGMVKLLLKAEGINVNLIVDNKTILEHAKEVNNGAFLKYFKKYGHITE